MNKDEKPIVRTIHYPEHAVFKTEDNGMHKIVEKVVAARVTAIDNSLTRAMYDLYKNSDITTLYIIDEDEFAHFLKMYLPIYQSKGHILEVLRDNLSVENVPISQDIWVKGIALNKIPSEDYSGNENPDFKLLEQWIKLKEKK